MSARASILKLLKSNIGKEVPRQKIIDAAKISDWPRRVRELRDAGWQIVTTSKGYRLTSSTPSKALRKDGAPISQKLRYKIIQAAIGVCQSCGAKVSEGARLVVDHQVPRAWGGATVESNLWAICTECNQGKRDFYSDQNAEAMRKIMAHNSAKARILALFQFKIGKKVTKADLFLVARISEWARRVRELRDAGWDIVSFNEVSGLKPGEYILRSLNRK